MRWPSSLILSLSILSQWANNNWWKAYHIDSSVLDAIENKKKREREREIRSFFLKHVSDNVLVVEMTRYPPKSLLIIELLPGPDYPARVQWPVATRLHYCQRRVSSSDLSSSLPGTLINRCTFPTFFFLFPGTQNAAVMQLWGCRRQCLGDEKGMT